MKFRIVIVMLALLLAVGITGTSQVSAQEGVGGVTRCTIELSEVISLQTDISTFWQPGSTYRTHQKITGKAKVALIVHNIKENETFLYLDRQFHDVWILCSDVHTSTQTGLSTQPVTSLTPTIQVLTTNTSSFNGSVNPSPTPGPGSMLCEANHALWDVILSQANGRISQENTLVQWAPGNTNRQTLVIITSAGQSLNSYNGAAWSYFTDNLEGCIATQLASFPDATSVIYENGSVFLTRSGQNIYDSNGTLIYTIP